MCQSDGTRTIWPARWRTSCSLAGASRGVFGRHQPGRPIRTGICAGQGNLAVRAGRSFAGCLPGAIRGSVPGWRQPKWQRRGIKREAREFDGDVPTRREDSNPDVLIRGRLDLRQRVTPQASERPRRAQNPRRWRAVTVAAAPPIEAGDSSCGSFAWVSFVLPSRGRVPESLSSRGASGTRPHPLLSAIGSPTGIGPWRRGRVRPPGISVEDVGERELKHSPARAPIRGGRVRSPPASPREAPPPA